MLCAIWTLFRDGCAPHSVFGPVYNTNGNALARPNTVKLCNSKYPFGPGECKYYLADEDRASLLRTARALRELIERVASVFPHLKRGIKRLLRHEHREFTARGNEAQRRGIDRVGVSD